MLLFASLATGCQTQETALTIQVIDSVTQKPLPATVHVDFSRKDNWFNNSAFEPTDQYLATDRHGLIVATIPMSELGQLVVYSPGYVISSTLFTTDPPPEPGKSPVTPQYLVHYLIEMIEKE